MFFILIFCSISSFVDHHGRLRVHGSKLIDSNGDIIVLRGVSFGSSPGFYNVNAIKQLWNQWKTTCIRVPVDLSDGDLAIESLYKAVFSAVKVGIYVLIDLVGESPDDEAREFFIRISSDFGHFPNIIYGFSKSSEDSVSLLIKTIRRIDRLNLIVLGNQTELNNFSGDVKLDYNVAYAIHVYAGDDNEELKELVEFAVNSSLYLFVTESAATNSSEDGDLFLEKYSDLISYLNEKDISWIAKSISSKNESSSAFELNADPWKVWKTTDLKKWGVYIRDKLNWTFYNAEKK
uniref:Putative carbohydrate-active enzyme n=1 Tax=Coptotermes formosanus TaxID=36987 RepID=R4V4Y7_COPFO|nr:putative carbohydrate-active enzyme [Coptotermes formosanus]